MEKIHGHRYYSSNIKKIENYSSASFKITPHQHNGSLWYPSFSNSCSIIYSTSSQSGTKMEQATSKNLYNSIELMPIFSQPVTKSKMYIQGIQPILKPRKKPRKALDIFCRTYLKSVFKFILSLFWYYLLILGG